MFFDYTCGFSNRARHWLDALDGVQVVWRPFSLLEQNRVGDGPPVFDWGALAENVSLIALAVHLAVGADGGNLDQYRRRMFTAWHEETGRLSTEDIVGFGRDAGMGGWDHDRAFSALAGEHAAAKQLGVFGTRPWSLTRNTRCSSSSKVSRPLTGHGSCGTRCTSSPWVRRTCGSGTGCCPSPRT